MAGPASAPERSGSGSMPAAEVAEAAGGGGGGGSNSSKLSTTQPEVCVS